MSRWILKELLWKAGKVPYMTLEQDPVAMDVMRSLKRLFDPHNILNPGKMAMEG
jgi:glycolate oxidase